MFFLDYKPFPVNGGECFIDWSPEEGEMIQLPISFEGVMRPSMFMHVTIRMDDGMIYPAFPPLDNRILVTP
jgi:hypothetical protein